MHIPKIVFLYIHILSMNNKLLKLNQVLKFKKHEKNSS